MTPESRELRDLLSYKLTGTSYQPSSHSEQNPRISFVVEAFEDWLIGDVEFDFVKEVFRIHIPSFDLMSWIKSKAEEGRIDDPYVTT